MAGGLIHLDECLGAEVLVKRMNQDHVVDGAEKKAVVIFGVDDQGHRVGGDPKRPHAANAAAHR